MSLILYLCLIIPFAGCFSLWINPIILFAGCFSVCLNPIILFAGCFSVCLHPNILFAGCLSLCPSDHFVSRLFRAVSDSRISGCRITREVTDGTPNIKITSWIWDYLNWFILHVISDLSSPQLPILIQLSVARILNVPHDLQLPIVTASLHICNTLFNLFTTWNQFVPHHRKLTDVTGNCQSFRHIVELRLFDTQQLKNEFTYISIL